MMSLGRVASSAFNPHFFCHPLLTKGIARIKAPKLDQSSAASFVMMRKKLFWQPTSNQAMVMSTLLIVLATVLGSGSARDSSTMTSDIISLHDFEKMHPGSFSETVPRELEKVMSIILPDVNANTTELETLYTHTLTSGLWEEQQRFTWQQLLRSSSMSSHTGSRELEDEGGLQTDRASNPLYPFLFCNSDVHLSGSKRRSFISSMLGHELSEVDRAMDTIFNDDSMSCFLALATTFEVEKVFDINTKMFPLTPLMKIKNWSYTIGAIRNQISVSGPIQVTSILCMSPGKVVDTYEALDILQYAVDRITAAMSPNEIQNKSDSIGLRGRVLQDISDLASCQNLKIEIDMIFTESSSISFNIFIDSKLSQERNVECALSFIVALSSHPAVCSVSTDERPETLNDMAQQIIQAGDLSSLGRALLSRPFCPYFDAGLTASNQIIGLSDTGIREDSCYFSDKNGPVARSAVSSCIVFVSLEKIHSEFLHDL